MTQESGMKLDRKMWGCWVAFGKERLEKPCRKVRQGGRGKLNTEQTAEG